MSDTPKAKPLVCFAVHPSNPRLVTLLKRGETGYWPSHTEPTPEYAAEYVNGQNKALRVSDIERAAMQNGSVFGWDVPGADADVLAARHYLPG